VAWFGWSRIMPFNLVNIWEITCLLFSVVLGSFQCWFHLKRQRFPSKYHDKDSASDYFGVGFASQINHSIMAGGLWFGCERNITLAARLAFDPHSLLSLPWQFRTTLFSHSCESPAQDSTLSLRLAWKSRENYFL
jgi:hypothetical protein